MLDQPLGLTVHSLPSPQQAEAAQRRTRTAVGRWKMIVVMLMCAAPVIASYFTYYVVRPQSHRSYGELVEPQRPLPRLAAMALDGRSEPLTALKGQWLLISVATGDCDAACEKHLYLQRQLREGLGKDKDRMDWVWLVSDTTAVRPALLPALAQATVLRVPAAELAGWLVAAPGHQVQEHLFLVDPLGNLMMRFPASLDTGTALQAKRDLDRLMRASAGWDKPGREGS
ncbi:MAG: cytochrome c oxidase subunit I [Ramlibacter sp.]